MTVFINVLKRILKNKIQLFFILILPAIFMIPISLNMNSEHPLRVGILDNDKTIFSNILYDSLKTKADVISIGSSNNHFDVLNSKIDYEIIISKGFTSGLIAGKGVQLDGYYLKDSVRCIPIRQYLKSFVDSSKAIAVSVNGNETKFYEGMSGYNNLGVKTNYNIISNIDRDRAYSSFGLFLMFVVMTSVLFTTLLLRDKENRTFYRTITAPVSLKSYMLQNILSFTIISFLQVTLVFVILKYLVGIYMGNSFSSMYAVFLFASVMCVSLGIAISSVSRNVVQAGFIGLFLSLPMSFLGGCWWPNATAPDVFRSIGRFTPVYWVMEAVNKLLYNNSLTSALNEILVIVAFSAIFFFLGTWKRESLNN